MASTRRLYTGAPGSALRDHLLDSCVPDPSSLYIVPSVHAAHQVKRILGSRAKGPAAPPRVWHWSDLWKAIGESVASGPTCLSATASDCVFHQAIRISRESGDLAPLDSVIHWPGYRRQLQDRIAGWTSDERPLAFTDPDTDPDTNEVAIAELALFSRYRALLNDLEADDAAGFEVWASHRLAKRPPEPFASISHATFLDWHPGASKAQWRFLAHVIKRAKAVHLSLVYEDAAPSRALYEATRAIRARLLDLGFTETIVPADLWRPAGLRAVEQSLFRTDAPSAGVTATHGLTVRGAPAHDGAARLIAHEIKTLLDQGTEPDEILVLFRRRDEAAERAFEIARDWGLPVHATAAPPLTRDPTLSALLLASILPITDWETTQLIRLLRHGQFLPDWANPARVDLAAAASVLEKTRVYRGRQKITSALDRAVVEAESQQKTADAARARQARAVVHRLFTLLEPLDNPRPWSEQVDHLMRVVKALGLGQSANARSEHPALDTFRDALEETGDLLDRLGRHHESWTWSQFNAQLGDLVLQTPASTPPPRPGSITFATLDQVTGVRVPFVILGNLAEGTFPSRAAVEPFLSLRPGQPPTPACLLAASREMLRFLRILGMAERQVTLVHPTTDSKGQELLRAGYLDDLLDLLAPEARSQCHQTIVRYDASLIDTPDLAGSPADHRVRATALAAARADFTALAHLHESPSTDRQLQLHSPAEGAATALEVLRARMRYAPFGIYDGLLSDPHAIEHIQQVFGPQFTFSPSQLETYIGCPFQFFSKYVLKLETTDERDELDEDFTNRGSRIHNILEQLEAQLLDRGSRGEPLDDQAIQAEANIAIQTHFQSELIDPTGVEAGLEEIERLRIELAVERYRGQSRNYLGDPRARPVPHLLEVDFGGEGSQNPCLEIADDQNTVRLRGKIDRIDLVDSPEGQSFRVIDYKSGSAPSVNQVRDARLLQLPLYAMAVERVILSERDIALRDVGYWGLKKEGFRSISFAEWQEVQAAVERYVMALVDRLRHGVFVVDSRIDDCETFCDFRAICRIRQVRAAAKQHDAVNPPELALTSARGARKGRDSTPTTAQPPRENSFPPDEVSA